MIKDTSKRCDECVHVDHCRLGGRHIPSPCVFYYPTPEAKTPSKFKRFLYMILCGLMNLVFIPIWFFVVIIRLPFAWVGKIADLLEDLERTIRHAAGDFADVTDAMIPECAWRAKYKLLKDKYSKLLDEKLAMDLKALGQKAEEYANEINRKVEEDGDEQ